MCNKGERARRRETVPKSVKLGTKDGESERLWLLIDDAIDIDVCK